MLSSIHKFYPLKHQMMYCQVAMNDLTGSAAKMSVWAFPESGFFILYPDIHSFSPFKMPRPGGHPLSLKVNKIKSINLDEYLFYVDEYLFFIVKLFGYYK